jgi:hypothetical protein
VSDVYYDTTKGQAVVELYTPIYSESAKKVTGIVRDTLSLEIIWNIINSENGANGSGSFAFILDQHGVRIFDPEPQKLFTAIAPLSPELQQKISDQKLYGHNGEVPIVADQYLSTIQSQKSPPTTFQSIPTGKDETFEITRYSLTAVSWTYFVLTPVNVLAAVANQQLLLIASIALLILIPAAIVGGIVGRRISFPILRSVESLVGSSAALNELAQRETTASLEQVWLVDTSKGVLKSIQYYTHASGVAIQQLNTLGRDLLRKPEKDPHSTFTVVAQMVDIGQYFEKAIAYQGESVERLALAIKVTDEVTEQLVSGAKSASEAANELDYVVGQLRQTVGNKALSLSKDFTALVEN